MVYIPAGEFEMGGSLNDIYGQCYRIDAPFYESNFDATACDGWYIGHEPIHSVFLDSYYIDKYEVTNGQYAKCVYADVCEAPQEPDNFKRYGRHEYLENPVVYVNWYQADIYCGWRDARLPTEAEWENAARGPDGWVFPWGNSWPEPGELLTINFCDRQCNGGWKNTDYDDGFDQLAPVDAYPPDAYGLHHMLGNVWEWIADYYQDDYYQHSPRNNPSGPDSGTTRVVRGGSWVNISSNLRADNRYYRRPNFSSNATGFRCVVDVP
jgi:formylglycine-generating enzyme required for sulfatase activity